MRGSWGWLGWIVCVVLTTAAGVRAANEDPVNRAIVRGLDFLKKTQKPDGTWPHAHIGATALAGLTLLECDVPADDPAVRKAAAAVRSASVSLTHTYSLALAVMFLDRLGDPGDIPLIESMTVRLLAGQNANGGWGYDCPPIGAGEVRRLTTHLQQRNILIGSSSLPKPEPQAPGQRRIVSREIQEQLTIINRQAPPAIGDDNSNTQFAVLGLWVSRRHGMPVDNALARVDLRFRKSQNPDGGWSYNPIPPGGSSTSMTCAGLLGLAINQGARAELRNDPKMNVKNKPPAQNVVNDPAIRVGLLALGTTVGVPMRGRGPGMIFDANVDYYFLWSLERVAVAYGLKTIGNKDWYAWGAEILLAQQEMPGSWGGGLADGGVNTCFALLFLRRANIAKDLTASLKGQVQDPGEVTLKTGGVGGEALKASALKPGNNPHGKPEILKSKNAPEGKDHPKPLPASASAPSPDADVARLTADLLDAPADRLDERIAMCRDGRGGIYTQALAAAIHRLEGAGKSKARDALTERLTRMKPATLRDKLQDADPEVRAAAALAAGTKEEKSFVPDLIALLDDPERRVARAAHVALKSMTGKDFGPSSDASAKERAEAVNAWKSWWNRRSVDSSPP